MTIEQGADKSNILLDTSITFRSLLEYSKEKISHRGVQKHAQNISWMFSAKIINMLISFLAMGYIARNLGPGNYGELSYAISFVGIFSFFVPLGMDQILLKYLAKYPDKKNEYLGTAITLRITASMVAIIVCVLSAFLISSKDVSLLLIFIISFYSVFSSFQLLSYEFLAEARAKYPSLLSLGIVFILNVLKILAIYFGKGVIYLALILLLESLLYCFGYLYLKTKIYKDTEKLRFNKEIALKILRKSYPLIFASAFYIIYTRIDQVMIKHMINADAVGLYDAAVRISELTYFIPSLLLISFFPALINAQKQSLELYHKRTKKLLLLILLTSCVIAALTTLFSKHIILIIFGSSFLGAVPVLYLYAWSTIGASLNSFAQQILIVENDTKNILISALLGMITNVSLNLYLIPLYGITGAAFATLISYMVPFLSLLLFKKTRILLLAILKI